MINLLTIDLEDYYQVSAFESVVKRTEWDKYESRIERNTYRLLDMLNETCIAQSAKRKTVVSHLPETSNLQPGALDPSPCALHPAPCANGFAYALHPAPCANGFAYALHPAPCAPCISSGVKATFFCLGWIAERFPTLIREIHNRGHEIACHGYDHQLIYNMTPDEFREDVRKSKKILEDIIGEDVMGYRAPSYSITKKSLWAFQILAEEGYRYDSSIFPIHHDRYGIPDAPRFPFLVNLDGKGSAEFVPLSDSLPFALCPMLYAPTAPNLNPSAEQNPLPDASSLAPYAEHPISFPLRPAPCASNQECSASRLAPYALRLTPHALRLAPYALRPIPLTPYASGLTPSSHPSFIEFPISTVRLFGQNLPVSGGGYFRLLPYVLVKKALSHINKKDNKPFIFYLHPWELDVDQPRFKNVSKLSQFRHHVNLKQTEVKLRTLLQEFTFSSIKEILTQNDAIPY